MMNNDLISVVVAVYNAETFLNRCVDSIINQTYTNLEIILVNDGSKDSSLLLCNEYKQTDGRVTVIDKENGGLTSARKAGFEKSRGKYIAFIDSDDYINRRYIEELYKSITENKSDIAICSYYLENENGISEKTLVHNKRVYSREDFPHSLILPGIYSLDTDKTKIPNFLWIRLFNREIITEDCFVSEREVYTEDLFFNIGAYKNCSKVSVVDKCLYYYCFNSGSLTHIYRKNRYLMEHTRLERIREILEKSGTVNLERLYLVGIRMIWNCIDNAMLTGNYSTFKKEIKLLYNDTALNSLPLKSVAGQVATGEKLCYYFYKLKTPFIAYLYKKAVNEFLRLSNKSKKLKTDYSRIIKDDIIHLKSVVSGLIRSESLDSGLTKNDKKIFVYLSGFYQNLGDMAITYAHEKFLKDNFPEYKIVMIPSTATYSTLRWVKRIITPRDIVTIVGGGNMDSSYSSLENCRRFVIKNFRKNKIVSFPQTMNFADTVYGNFRLKKTVNTYRCHKNLHIFAREENSYLKMKDLFKDAKTVELTPDIVLYLNFVNEYKENRDGALCVFRNDIEKAQNFDVSEVRETLSSVFKDVQETDTVNVSREDCKPDTYKDTVKSFLKMISGKKLVVTDRLHCMIFCAVTGTPCIAFDNSNKKISGVYKMWLGDLNYISVSEDFNADSFKNECRKYADYDYSVQNEFSHGDEFQKIKNILLN